jgi:ribosomal protein S17
MKNKKLLIVLVVLIGIILLDTLQAIILKHSPIISWKEEIADDDSWVNRGILIDTYYCTKEQDIVTVSWKFKGNKFTCPIDNVQIKEFDITLENLNDKINDYFSKDNVDKSNISYCNIDREKNVVVVGMLDISIEKQNEFINNVFSSCCGSKYIKYIKDNEMIEFKESIEIFEAEIVETKEDYMIVKVLKECKSFKKDDKVRMQITRPTSGINDFYVVGNKVRITFNGLIEDTNPPQIGVNKIELITN